MQLTKQQIFDAQDIVTETVNVPQWGGDVTVKTWTAEEKADFEIGYESNSDTRGKRQFREIVVAFSVIDADGSLMFTLDDVEKLSAKSGAALDIVFEVASKLNHILATDEETMVKN